MNFASLFKRLLPVAGLIFATGPAFAIQDTNTNGLSDVWERHYNGGNLFTGANPSHAPTADPDSDGWDNAKEAIAGTDPFSTALPAGWVKSDIAKHPDAEGLFILKWPSVQGKVYKLAMSPDLVAWTDFGELMPGTGQNISLAVDAIHEDGTIPDRLFWRVKIEDDDPDGDTLTTWEELALGYNPYSSDTDLDGIPDNTDTTPLSNNAVADPDGAGLVGTTLSTNMIGRWDFESYDTITSPPTGHTPWRFPDKTTGGRHATSFSVFTHGLGMPSKATSHAGGFVTIPPSLLNNRTTWSVSFWAALDEGSVENSDGRPVGLFTHHYYLPHITNGSPNWGLVTAKVNGIWVQKIGGREILRAGTYSYTNHNGGTLISPPTTVVSGVMLDRDLGTIDDGKWHHYVMTRAGGKTTLYIDGQKAGEKSHTFETITANQYAGISLGRVYGPSPDSIVAQPGNQAVARGRFDRLRAWSDAVTTTEIAALHHEDIDRDGLWDITETKTRLWRDANSDATATPAEFDFVVSPFEWQPAEHDTDRDEASDLAEQIAGTDIAQADTDGDLIPDGWELKYPAILDPLDPSDGLLDPDGDGLTNREEWQYNTNPTNPNSDGGDPDNPDTVNDGDEVDGGSNPNDPGDVGQSPSPEEKVSILLGVGDQSGSESEDYVLNCYRIDRETGEEERIYTVRSGGFGQYKQETKDIFRKGESYSFQIQWQGSNLASRPANPSLGISAEGPDFDYTFKVQSQGDHGGMLIDSWNPSDGTLDPTRRLLNDEANDVAADASEFKRNYSDRRVVLYSVQTHTIDRMFAGAVTILPGFEQMELTITSPDTGRDFGTHGYLVGGGDTRVYESVKGMLGYEDRWGTLVSDPSVWFLRDPLSFNRVEFYLVSGAPGEAYGKIKVEAKVQGQSLGSIERTLQADAQFAQTIDLVTGWAAGRGFGFNTGGGGGVTVMNNLLDGEGLDDPHHWSTPTLIPFMLIGHQVEGVTIVVRGLGEGVVAGLKDDLEFVGLILSGAVIVADWSAQALLNEIEKWQNDPRARMSELHAMVTDFFDKQVFQPLATVAADLTTFEGFKKRFWQAVAKGITVSIAVNTNLWYSTVNALEEWFDDFGNRMADGAERAAWLDTPLDKTGLFAEGTQLMREQCYTFGYTFGYLCEQVAIGALTGGTVKIAQVAAKGGISLAANVAKRTAATVAIRGHWMKKIMADSGLGDAIIRAMYERGMLAAAVEPTGPTIKKCAFDILESLFSRQGFNRATYNFKEFLDDLVPDGNIRKLMAKEGSEAVIHKRAAQIAHLLGDECDETVMKNFMDVVEQRLILERSGGEIDEWIEDFLRAFKGNAAEFVNRPPLDDLSSNGVQRLKNFLSEPLPGYAWKFEEGLETNWKAPIVRGLLVELELWYRVYKPAGWAHLPTSEAVDFIKGVQALQLKSIGTVNSNTITRMKEAVLAMRDYGVSNGKTDLILDIRKKPGLDTSALQQQLDDYIATLNPSNNGLTITFNIHEYDFLPAP